MQPSWLLSRLHADRPLTTPLRTFPGMCRTQRCLSLCLHSALPLLLKRNPQWTKPKWTKKADALMLLNFLEAVSRRDDEDAHALVAPAAFVGDYRQAERTTFNEFAEFARGSKLSKVTLVPMVAQRMPTGVQWFCSQLQGERNASFWFRQAHKPDRLGLDSHHQSSTCEPVRLEQWSANHPHTGVGDRLCGARKQPLHFPRSLIKSCWSAKDLRADILQRSSRGKITKMLQPPATSYAFHRLLRREFFLGSLLRPDITRRWSARRCR